MQSATSARFRAIVSWGSGPWDDASRSHRSARSWATGSTAMARPGSSTSPTEETLRDLPPRKARRRSLLRGTRLTRSRTRSTCTRNARSQVGPFQLDAQTSYGRCCTRQKRVVADNRPRYLVAQLAAQLWLRFSECYFYGLQRWLRSWARRELRSCVLPPSPF